MAHIEAAFHRTQRLVTALAQQDHMRFIQDNLMNGSTTTQIITFA